MENNPFQAMIGARISAGILAGAIVLGSTAGAFAQQSQSAAEPKPGNIEKRLEPLNPKVRDVTPEGVYRGQDWRSDKVERLPDKTAEEETERRKPAGHETGNPTEKVQSAESNDGQSSDIIADGKHVIWKQPRVLSGGRVISKGTLDNEYGESAITFSGIKALAVGATCQVEQSDKRWNCGRFAKGALALLLQGRSIFCLPVKVKSRKISTRCEVGGHDISVWLVRHGWAEPDKEVKNAKFKQKLDEALKYAKANKKGIWLTSVPSASGG